MKKLIKIGIGAIGSGVGQSIIDSCRLSGLPLYTIGFGTNPYAYGAYDCDERIYTSSIYDPGYAEEILHLCIQNGIDVYIPGLDDEALLLSSMIEAFEKHGIGVIVSGRPLLEIARDKEKMSRELNAITDNFVKSYSQKELLEAVALGTIRFPLIAKPRSGFASRGIFILRSQKDLSLITDNHIVQELAIPCSADPNRDFYLREINAGRNPQISEISVQIVVGRSQELLGRAATYNKLQNGVPIEITPYDNSEVWQVIDRLLPTFLKLGLKGPLNIQGRLTDTGFRIFEMNPRFTGITGLRAIMGFNEVEACIKSWLKWETSQSGLQLNHNRFGMRQVQNKSVFLMKEDKAKSIYIALNGCNAIGSPKILLTGADGFLGSTILREAFQESSGKYRWAALVRNKNKLEEIANKYSFEVFDYNELKNGILNLGNIDVLIHAAFARPYRGEAAIAESMSMTMDLFTRAAMHQIPRIINISSQSVYGSNSPPWKEEQKPMPNSIYGQAKLACELHLDSLTKINPSLEAISLRLATLMGPEPQPVDLVSKFIEQLLAGQKIEIWGGKQLYQRLDVRDAARAVLAAIEIPESNVSPVYNITASRPMNIVELAEYCINGIKRAGKECIDEIAMLPGDDESVHMIDGSLFIESTGWFPRYSIEDTVNWILQNKGFH